MKLNGKLNIIAGISLFDHHHHHHNHHNHRFRSRRKVRLEQKRIRIRPCLSVCQTVEQKCPYMLPADRAPNVPTQYAGEPTFLCLGKVQLSLSLSLTLMQIAQSFFFVFHVQREEIFDPTQSFISFPFLYSGVNHRHH